MCSTQQENDTESTDANRVCGNKCEKTRRSWTGKEEEVLIAALKELVVLGWKADNGFRAGYLNKLEEAMRKVFPGTDLKGMPHINSKISAWKRSYSALTGILKITGVGFNLHGTFLIDCDNEQWAQIRRSVANSKNMRFKSWPLLEDWKEVFGKDRATGEHAEDCMDAVNEMINEDNVAQTEGGGDYHVSLDGDNGVDEADDSVCQSQKVTGSGRAGAKKKRKQTDGFEGVYELLDAINRTIETRLENLAKRIGYEFDLAQARKEAYEQLTKMPELTMYDKFDACELLAFKVERLEIFMCLPEDARALYVLRLLEQRGH